MGAAPLRCSGSTRLWVTAVWLCAARFALLDVSYAARIRALWAHVAARDLEAARRNVRRLVRIDQVA